MLDWEFVEEALHDAVESSPRGMGERYTRVLIDRVQESVEAAEFDEFGTDEFMADVTEARDLLTLLIATYGQMGDN